MKSKLNLANQVMSEIKSKNLRMRPLIYFQSLDFSTKLLLAALLLTAAVLLNISIFKFRIYAPFEFLKFGDLGLRAFLGTIPWNMMAGALVSAATLMWFVKKFHILYRRQFSHLAFGMVVLVTIGGTVIDQTGINHKLKREGSFPNIYYGQYTSNYWAMGEIEDIDKNNYRMIIKTPVHDEITLTWNSSTILPKGDFLPGQYIKAVGGKQGELFVAKGIIFSSITDLD
ncbi:hypothetical protein HYW42_05590 [Candidatus Daviesbacteria bacterium]|nr:hypothetical protein [Candidatus Daviesbacteria bacterium]